MDRHNVIGHDGTVHEGLFNAHTGFLIDVACDAGRYAVVQPYGKLDPARVTVEPLTCPACQAAVTGDAPHPADVARECADAVLADAGHRGYPPSLDDEGLERAFVRLLPDSGKLRPIFERLAQGVYAPPGSYSTDPLYARYALIREHLTDTLTERALTVPDGTPRVLVDYHRYTGGILEAPVGVGDRLMHDGTASGMWYHVTVIGVDDAGVDVRDRDGWKYRWTPDELRRWFLKLDRAPLPAGADA